MIAVVYRAYNQLYGGYKADHPSTFFFSMGMVEPGLQAWDIHVEHYACLFSGCRCVVCFKDRRYSFLLVMQMTNMLHGLIKFWP